MAHRNHTTARTTEPTRPTLPPTRAFVVQIHADAEPARGALVGRIEHLASGAAARFTSLEQLAAFIRRTLDANETEPPP